MTSFFILHSFPGLSAIHLPDLNSLGADTHGINPAGVTLKK